MLTDYFQAFAGKRVALLGLARSNLPLVEPLYAAGATLILCDKDIKEGFAQLPRWQAMGCELHFGDDYLSGWEADVVIRTPGIRPDIGRLPEMAAKGAVITSEMELFFERCPCMTYAVTGSDGKTTTTSLIAAMVEQSGVKTWLGGNIGHPLLPMIDKISKGDRVVVELSSFQLMGMKRSADVAVLTNISPNHLDWHKDYDEYKQAKETIFRYQAAEQTVVLNRDNYESYKLHGRAKGNVVTFGIDNDANITIKGGKLTVFGTEIMDMADWKLPGRYNAENLLAAVGATWDRVPLHAIVTAAKNFTGVEHRLEWVRRHNGVDYYNNSIATSPSRVVASLKAYEKKIILIAGGAEKGIPFDELAAELPVHVKHLILTGNSAARQIEAAAKATDNCPPIMRVDTMQQAVEAAACLAGEGDTVALMPACTAFDAYKDFAARGEDFKRLVRDL
ncbi:MAG: UDP-N-acetylmuramoyl-L-alanine--D-glutamate ligase [Oscillospiraceae bacterium]|nr:UDP-N-acetylmuramoyl-L-alanine--D-glutamate ligase [Oscillospiraceae bacterium]